jgi:hypothetical protein
MDEKQRQTLLAAVLAAAGTDGEKRTLSCAEAHRIADEHGVERQLVGRICNDNQVRVTTCQLGLFP